MTRRQGDPHGARWKRAAVVAGLITVSATLAGAAPPAPLALRTVQQSGAPGKYSPAGENPMAPGLCMEILAAVERVDPGLRFTGLPLHAPLRRIERMLAQDEIDAFFCLLRTPEREQQWRYLPVPLFKIRHMIVQRANDAAEYRSYADLAASARPVLVAQGSALQETLTRARVPTNTPPSEREALKMLLLGRADAVYGQDINLLRNMRDSGLAERLRLGSAVFQEEFQYAVVSRQLPPEAEQRLLQALQTLERDGTLKTLAAKYR